MRRSGTCAYPERISTPKKDLISEDVTLTLTTNFDFAYLSVSMTIFSKTVSSKKSSNNSIGEKSLYCS